MALPGIPIPETQCIGDSLFSINNALTALDASVIQLISAGASVTVSTTAPSSPSEGDLWFNSTSGIMYMWYTDGSSDQWVEVGGGGGGASTAISTTPPSSPSEGDLWFDSVNGILYVYYGSQWVETGTSVPVGGGTDKVFWENDQVVTTNYTITTGKNAMTAGPITINSGVSVTVPAGSVWTVV